MELPDLIDDLKGRAQMQEHRNLGIFTIDRVDFIVEEIRCSCGWAEQVPASGAAQRWLAGRFGNHIATET